MSAPPDALKGGKFGSNLTLCCLSAEKCRARFFTPLRCAQNDSMAEELSGSLKHLLNLGPVIFRFKNCAVVVDCYGGLDSYCQTLCSLSHTFLRYRPFRLSTLDCLRRAENFI